MHIQLRKSEGRKVGSRCSHLRRWGDFRYRFNSFNDGENIIEEATTYPIAEGIRRWNQPLKIDYEGFYTPTQSGISDRDPRSGHINTSWSYPLLLEPSDSVFVLITEANIQRNRCGSYLSNAADSSAYRLQLADSYCP